MTLELLYFPGCPHHERTVSLIQSVLEAEGVHADLRQVAVNGYEDALALRFPGSPTVRVNGEDIEHLARDPIGVGFACRTYLVEGRPEGVPPRSWIERAIRVAREREIG